MSVKILFQKQVVMYLYKNRFILLFLQSDIGIKIYKKCERTHRFA